MHIKHDLTHKQESFHFLSTSPPPPPGILQQAPESIPLGGQTRHRAQHVTVHSNIYFIYYAYSQYYSDGRINEYLIKQSHTSTQYRFSLSINNFCGILQPAAEFTCPYMSWLSLNYFFNITHKRYSDGRIIARFMKTSRVH